MFCSVVNIKKKLSKYLIIALLSALFIVVFYLCLRIDKDTNYPFVLEIDNNGANYIIKPYKKDDIFYYMLPSNVESYSIKFKTYIFNNIKLDNITIKNDDFISKILFNNEYILNGDVNQKVLFMKSNNISTMYITLSNGTDLSYIDSDKDNSSSGNVILVDENGTVNYANSFDHITGRGSQSWTFDKKGYLLELHDEASLLSMSKEKKWVLVANAFDDSDGLRNYIAYNIAKNVGISYSCDLKFIELYINGNYRGTYQLLESISICDERLNIGDLDIKNNETNNCTLDAEKLQQNRVTDDNYVSYYTYSKIASPNDISGGYVLERNYGYKLNSNIHIFETKLNEGFVVKYPEVCSKEEMEYISYTFQRIENALFSMEYIDQESGLRLSELIDFDSWVKKYLVDEITKNEGAGSTSSYFYKKENDDLVYAGPAWDYDKSLGRFDMWQDTNELTYSSWHINFPTVWWAKLYQNEEANKLIRKYYLELFRPYCIELINSKIDEWSTLIFDSFKMNYVLWEDSYKEFGDFPEEVLYRLGDLDNSVDYIKTWLYKRIEFLDGVWYEY